MAYDVRRDDGTVARVHVPRRAPARSVDLRVKIPALLEADRRGSVAGSTSATPTPTTVETSPPSTTSSWSAPAAAGWSTCSRSTRSGRRTPRPQRIAALTYLRGVGRPRGLPLPGGRRRRRVLHVSGADRRRALRHRRGHRCAGRAARRAGPTSRHRPTTWPGCTRCSPRTSRPRPTGSPAPRARRRRRGAARRLHPVVRRPVGTLPSGAPCSAWPTWSCSTTRSPARAPTTRSSRRRSTSTRSPTTTDRSTRPGCSARSTTSGAAGRTSRPAGPTTWLRPLEPHQRGALSRGRRAARRGRARRGRLRRRPALRPVVVRRRRGRALPRRAARSRPRLPGSTPATCAAPSASTPPASPSSPPSTTASCSG